MALTSFTVVLLGAAFPLLFFFFFFFSPAGNTDDADRVALQLQVLFGANCYFCLVLIAEAGEVGVNYGRVANDLPDPASVVELLKQNGITMVKVFDTNPRVLASLASTGIKVAVMMPNENIAAAAGDQQYALDWARSNVAAYYPATQIRAVAVGNEVFDSSPGLAWSLVPAMANVHRALADLGLADAIEVSTPVAFSAVDVSWPPSAGRFRGDIAEPVMRPMLDLLQRTGSYLTVNLYPFFAYAAVPDKISHDYFLGNPNPGVRDPVTGLTYTSLLDAQLDATHFAMDKLGFTGLRAFIGETGSPSGGTNRGPAASKENAQAYNNNVINRVLSGRTGTPHRPDADMDVYIFALFNENQKGFGPNDIEQHFGLFYPDMRKVYEFDFHGGGPTAESWCVANAGAGDARLLAALDYACANGADCGPIQPGAPCFEPNTMVAHASYAFNSYYQRNHRASGTCDFAGAAYIVYHEPAGTCDPSTSWCVANAGAGNARLLVALNYACANGADCSAIQPGAACFEPNTMVAHASYAFNSYYQRNHRASGTCDFAGAAYIVHQAPKYGNCELPSKIWIEEPSEGYAAI
ncbi:Glucan endo-1,3-beta-glucosidase 13 [Dichanthelium oligosanthes]|uniref:glucan endo-1,3-beta-D-glucosidase n=1 Tax=Dichanthelium oligosanthes TaxID=888268 RepID=A0A1E5W4A2_9POAL|nr:Glucan endo-1,3-beta-glucosidase 13 [Dichanthelium oligosanthes]